MTAEKELLEAVRRWKREQGSHDSIGNLIDALAAYDAAQPTEATHVRHTLKVWEPYEGGDLYGDPESDKSTEGVVIARVSFWLPKPQPPQEIEGKTEESADA